VLVFALAAFVYNLNFQRIAAGDTVAASLLPFSIWMDGSLTADRFYPYLAKHAPSQTQGFQIMDGRAYSGYPVALPLLLTPLYAPVALLARAAEWDPGRTVLMAGVLEKLTASLIAAFSVTLFYLLTCRLYAFATETWSVSSQALWQHGGGELGVILGLYGLVCAWREPEYRAALLTAGLGAGLAAAIRPSNALFFASVLAWFWVSKRRLLDLVWFSIAPVILGSATLAYNLQVFGRVSWSTRRWFCFQWWVCRRGCGAGGVTTDRSI
jgi:hypothetical protein